jgi:ParB family chromosome partitioning protein
MSAPSSPTPAPKRRALGKGLDVLFPGAASNAGAGAGVTVQDPKVPKQAVLQVAIEDLEPNRGQPRKKFHDHSIQELAENIRQHGLIQPILVRKKAKGFEIIAGERRWRASQAAGLKTVDVIVKDLSDDDAFVVALVENIAREDLNPIEEAEAYRHIIGQRAITQEQLAGVVGKDRSSVANALRLLKLPERVRRMVADGALSMGHARALLSLDSEEAMTKMAQEVVKRGLSVRQVERLVRLARKGAEKAEASPADPYASIPGGGDAIRRETDILVRRLGTRVRINAAGRRGKIEIDFSSPDELDRLIGILKG